MMCLLMFLLGAVAGIAATIAFAHHIIKSDCMHP